ncbi:hypothetical protein [Thiobacillus thioparus]|uniref:hypothetical protein n=1 Tax=Thiobacillus thioparus TaxID=931 RepID=UPI00037E05C7|nr:hypothetical protein [Thiobacillus thioparus]
MAHLHVGFVKHITERHQNQFQIGRQTRVFACRQGGEQMVVPTEFKLASADPDSSVPPQANRIESEAVNARPQDIPAPIVREAGLVLFLFKGHALGDRYTPGWVGPVRGAQYRFTLLPDVRHP